MDAQKVLALLALFGFSSTWSTDCSYHSLLKHLKLTPASDALLVARPVKNWTHPTTVGIDMVVFGILHVNEKSQTVESHIWIQMSWKNEFLTWNTSEFCGINVLTVPRSRLWLPDITISEDTSDTGTIHHGPLLTLLHDGLIVANSRRRLTTTCELQLNAFPFDTQECSMSFMPFNSLVEEISLGSMSNDSLLYKVSEQLMVTQGEWELVNLEVEDEPVAKNDVKYSRLMYTITIARKPMLYVINFIIPLFYFLVLDLASFFISESRGEKLSFKVTLLLSISVMLLILQDMLPSTESRMPFIASYCVAIFALVGISVLEAMLVSFLYDLDSYCANKHCCSGNTTEEIELEETIQRESPGAAEDYPEKQDKTVLPLNGPDGCELLKQILEELQAAHKETRKAKEDTQNPGRYRKMADIVDHVFFFLYLFTVVIFLVFMYSEWLSKMKMG